MEQAVGGRVRLKNPLKTEPLEFKHHSECLIIKRLTTFIQYNTIQYKNEYYYSGINPVEKLILNRMQVASLDPVETNGVC